MNRCDCLTSRYIPTLYVLPRGELRKELLNCLRQHRKRRRPRSRGEDRRWQITDMLRLKSVRPRLPTAVCQATGKAI